MNTKLSLLIALFSLTIFMQQGAAQQKSIYDSTDTEKNTQRNLLRKEIHKGSDKVALIVGIDKYQYIKPLQYATHDAQIIKEALEQQDYEVIEAHDVDLKNFKEIVNELRKKLDESGTLIIFYAGHGAEIDGINYLIPADAKPQNKYEFEDHCIDLDYIFRRIDKPDIAKILIIDACRDNPLDYRGGNKIQKIQLQKKNTMIIYSTTSTTTVKDTNPFAEILADNISKGGCIETIIRETRASVEREADEEQIVWTSSSLKDDVCFDDLSSDINKSKIPKPEFANSSKKSENSITNEPIKKTPNITEGTIRMSKGEYNALTIKLIANKREVHNLWTKYTYKKIGGKPIYNGRKKELFVKRIRNAEMSSHPMNLYSKIEAHGASTLLTVWVDLGNDEFLHSQKHPLEYEVVRKWLLDFAQQVTRK